MVEEPVLLRYEEKYSQKHLEVWRLNWAMKKEIEGGAREEEKREEKDAKRTNKAHENLGNQEQFKRVLSHIV